VAICTQCGRANPADARFCMGCAAPLTALASDQRWERRVVSVVFADLEGFTGRSERLDVEDVQRFLGRYHEVLRGEFERHGGAVEKFIGDAVVALFGVPVAHEDDPERAVRSALAIQGSVAEMRERDGVDLHVRVGVTAGEALVASLPAQLKPFAQVSKHADAPFDAVLFEGDSDELLALVKEVAKRSGPIVSVQGVSTHALENGDEDYALERLLTERSVSVNTAAAGGNANLMTIG